MGDPVSTTLIASAVLGTATSLYQVDQARDQRKKAESDARKRDEELSRLEAEKDQAEKTKRRRSSLAVARRGLRVPSRSGTLLTGPYGLGSGQSTGTPRKTLLGE